MTLETLSAERLETISRKLRDAERDLADAGQAMAAVVAELGAAGHRDAFEDAVAVLRGVNWRCETVNALRLRVEKQGAATPEAVVPGRERSP